MCKIIWFVEGLFPMSLTVSHAAGITVDQWYFGWLTCLYGWCQYFLCWFVRRVMPPGHPKWCDALSLIITATKVQNVRPSLWRKWINSQIHIKLMKTTERTNSTQILTLCVWSKHHWSNFGRLKCFLCRISLLTVKSWLRNVAFGGQIYSVCSKLCWFFRYFDHKSLFHKNVPSLYFLLAHV